MKVVRFVFIVVKILVMVFWVVMPCSDVPGYEHFGGPSSRWSLHPEDRDSAFHHNLEDHSLYEGCLSWYKKSNTTVECIIKVTWYGPHVTKCKKNMLFCNVISLLLIGFVSN